MRLNMTAIMKKIFSLVINSGGTDDLPKALKATLGLPLQMVTGYKTWRYADSDSGRYLRADGVHSIRQPPAHGLTAPPKQQRRRPQ